MQLELATKFKRSLLNYDYLVNSACPAIWMLRIPLSICQNFIIYYLLLISITLLLYTNEIRLNYYMELL